MELSRSEKTAFALKLKEMVNTAYVAETQSSQNELSYMGACRITDAIEAECERTIGTFPNIIKGACHLARAFRNPDKLKSKEDIRKGLALLIATAGGLSLILGILSGFSIWTVGAVILALHTPVLGPVMLVAGLAAAVAGVYAAVAKQTPQALSAKAHDVLIEAISNWSDASAAKAKDEAAEAELKLKASKDDINAAKGSSFWTMIPWPFRSTAKPLEEGPAKAEKPSPKATGDWK